ncbi:MAG: hypothetical protein Tsb0034_03810 [Ekhidna sp.]
MKKVMLLVFAIPLFAESQIKFETSGWDQALKLAKEQDKLIFLDAYAEWCEPCKVMEEYTFSDLEVGNFYNQNFINVRMDMEDYPGVELAEKFVVGVYPSLLFVNGDGEVIHRGCGSQDATAFLQLGEDALNDTLNLAAYERQYAGGDRSPDFLIDYLDLLDGICLDAEGFASDYLQSLKTDELTGESGWAVLAAYQWDIFSREFQYLINNKQLFEDAIGKEAVNAKIYDTYLSQYQEVYLAEELHDFGMRALMHSMGQVTFIGSDTLTVMLNLHYAEFKEEWETFAQNAIEFVGMTGMDHPEELGELAWKFYLYIDDRNQLEIAASWAKQAVDKLPEPSLIDTYASLQFKLGNRKEAVSLEEKALELARELYEDTRHYEYQLKKFQGK